MQRAFRLQGGTRGLEIVDGPGGTVEYETFTCIHCNEIVRVPHRASPDDCGGFCRQCMAPTCPKCTAKGVCTPFLKKVEEIERRARMLAAIGV